MVYLPACTVPRDRGAKPLRWWHYPLAIFLPFIAAAPVAPLVVYLREWLGVQLEAAVGNRHVDNDARGSSHGALPATPPGLDPTAAGS